MKNSSRRQFLKNASLAGLTAIPLTIMGANHQVSADTRLKVICVGGHPDDPESGCGGTLSKMSAAGHDVTIVYLTRGEAGIAGKSHQECADIRTKEALAACKILNVKAHFLGQVDGDTIVNNEWINKLVKYFDEAKPDIVFAHWPIDTHRDHQAASVLTIQAWNSVKEKFMLYFYEVCAGEQTLTFQPTDYVDISNERETKRKAVYCHISQDPPGIYACGHEAMEKFRGIESGAAFAEAFVKMKGRGRGFML